MRSVILIAAGLALTPAASGAAANDAAATANAAPEGVATPPAGIDERQVINPLDAARECPDTPMSLARKATGRPQLRRLDELPSAPVFAAVDRRVDNCPAPMILSKTTGR